MLSYFHRYLFFTMFLINTLDYLKALELLELRIPDHVYLGARVHLSCHWALDPVDVLYSVKWYKDGSEFFRHVPRDAEPRRKFPLPGVDVEEFNSSGSNLTLAPADLETGGRFRCEVSGDRPRFHTVSKYADMRIIAVPTHGPTISGFKAHYNLGDCVKVNCTTIQSKPAAELAWYINGEPASSGSASLPEYTKNNGLDTTNRRLAFKIEKQHLVGELKIKCLATLPSIYWQSVEETATISGGIIRDISEDNVAIAHSVIVSGTLEAPCHSWSLRLFSGALLFLLYFHS